MQTYAYDAFISYPEIGVAQVQPLVKALEDAGLKIFWDRNIPPGQDWMDFLEQKILSSRHTIVCVSSAALRSKFMLAEVKVSGDKIIPLFLEATDLPLIWEARIGHLQRADIRPAQFSLGDPAFAQLCAIISGRTEVLQRSEQTLEDRARHLIENSQPSDLSLVLALAILGGAATDAISLFAADFERRYREMVHHAPQQQAAALESMRTRLRRLHAEIFVRSDQRFNVKVECARFEQPTFGHTVLALAWSEYDQLRAPMVDWILGWAADSRLWIRLRLALNLGILAQDERRFDAIWRHILRPMLSENVRRRGRAARQQFEVADAALSIATLDASRMSTVETILTEMIAEQEGPRGLLAPRSGKSAKSGTAAAGTGQVRTAQPPSPPPANSPQPAPAASPDANATSSSQPEHANADSNDTRDDLAGGGTENSRIYLVARLAFGYTGARYPDLAIKAIRRLVDRGNFKALEVILDESFRDTMSASKGAADGSLWDPVDLLAGLLRWAADVPKEDQIVPLTIFAFGLVELPLASDRDDQPSLTSMLQRRSGIDALRRGILLGLARLDTRESFTGRLKDWRAVQRREPIDPDPVMALACTLINGATPGRDRDRVRSIFRDYDDVAIQTLATKFPVLIQRTEP